MHSDLQVSKIISKLYSKKNYCI